MKKNRDILIEEVNKNVKDWFQVGYSVLNELDNDIYQNKISELRFVGLLKD